MGFAVFNSSYALASLRHRWTEFRLQQQRELEQQFQNRSATGLLFELISWARIALLPPLVFSRVLATTLAPELCRRVHLVQIEFFCSFERIVNAGLTFVFPFFAFVQE